MKSQKYKDYRASIHASYTIHAYGELYDAMTRLATFYIEQGETQLASDILAFVLLQTDLPNDIYEQAYELFDDLERRICPRVIWDAKAFAQDMDMQGMVEYVLDVDIEENDA